MDDRRSFVGDSIKYGAAVNAGSSRLANKLERSTRALVDDWIDAQTAVDALKGLMQHPRVEVQFSAASYLLGVEKNEEARAILEEIGEQKTGFMAVSARAVLRVRYRQTK